ncbi:transmembrane emp24 domain-containing protein 7 [Penaeus vannamei]|uniref:Transmembrane emp24 domain-containing protein 7 n=1 Tax=Penaeus vannamei TaxID=6689 RepID=A0A3R7QPF4_PENVA|nr:transmembrane emp24 domain-containing protein 7 [Penaeus vannamei]
MEELVKERMEELVKERMEELVKERMEELVKERMEELVKERMEELVKERMEELVKERMEELVKERMEELVKERMEELVKERMEELVKERMEELVKERMEELVKERMEELVKERMEELVNERMEELVVTGGHYDVDVLVEGPARQILYREIKQQYGQFQFTPDHTGTYQVCFSNEFSTFSHKLIYVDFQVGDEPQLPGVGDFTAMTQMESSSQKGSREPKLYNRLSDPPPTTGGPVTEKSRGPQRTRPLLGCGETLGILVIAVGQVMILKNFFADKKSNQAAY